MTFRPLHQHWRGALAGIAASQKVPSNRHMASYAITVRGNPAGFDVEIVARDGV